MKKINLFYFGFGQVAKYHVRYLKNKNKKIFFSTTNTKKTITTSFENYKFKTYKFKTNIYDKKILTQLEKFKYFLISIPPTNGIDHVLNTFGNYLKHLKNTKIIYLSSTSVYGNHNGKWVNENSICKPTSLMGKNRLKAENQWSHFCKKNKLNINILRLSGIYSKERNVIKRLQGGLRLYVKKKNHFFSRIRVEDIAQVIDKIFNSKKISGQIFNVSDDKPASSYEITKYSAKMLKIKKIFPQKLNILSETLKQFYKDSKKVNNKKIKKVLKIKLKFPTYKHGLRDLI